MFSKQIDATAKSSAFNLLLRPFGMLLAAIYTPLLLEYLGEEANGVWATVMSLITWINYCDLGIGNGLRNLLSKELAKREYKKAQETVSTSYIVLSLIAVVMLLVLVLLSIFLDWNSILKTSLVVTPMILITVVYIVVNFILALSNSILYAMQLSERVSLRSCIVQIINIVGIMVLRSMEKGNLVYMAILFGSSTSIVYLYNTVVLIRKKPFLRPEYRYFDREKVKDITNVGVQFFIIQLTAVLILSSQNFIVSYLFGATAVTPINTVNTAYAAIYSAMAAIVVPMWSRTTEAIAKGEFKWVRNALTKVRRIGYLFIFFLIIITVIYKPISRIWLGRVLDYQPGVIVSTCIFYMMQIMNLIFVQFYYGMGDVRKFMWINVIQATLVVPLAIILSKYIGLGVAGVKLASAIMLATSAILLPFLTYGKLRKLEDTYNKTSNPCTM